MNNVLIPIFQLFVFLFSVIIHEVSHGLTAQRLGDPTAKMAGRLTLNPMKHLEWFGSFILPLTLYLVGSPILFGWAKPVPFNPHNLKNLRRDSGLIGAAGPLSNFFIAIIFALIGKFLIYASLAHSASPVFIFLDLVILVNLVLGIFNLMPIAPLDGSKIIFAILPDSPAIWELENFMERYGFFILLIFIFFGLQLIAPIVDILYNLLSNGALK